MRPPRIVGLRVQLGLAIALALVVVSTAAQAQILAAVLDGLQENPSISTNAFGTFVAVIADDEQSINVVLNYNPLEGGMVLAAHIHVAREFVNGGIVINLCGAGGKPACPTPSGQVAAMVTAADVVDLAAQGIAAGELAEVIRAMRRGATYVNVHSTAFPGGEIRAQIR
jgi:CHRD domain-containing protein